jgi:hypothetical protein
MKPLKELSYDLRKKVVNSHTLNNEEIKQVISHKLYLLGTVRGFNIMDRISILHHVSKVRDFYDAEQPNHEAIKKQSETHRLSLKYKPTRCYKTLNTTHLFDVTETEQFQLYEKYKEVFPLNSRLQIGSLHDNLIMLKALQKNG